MGVVSSIIGGTAQVASTNATNNANREIAQMNNQFNERMLDKQINYNKEMYETQLQDSLKYSDPSFIKSRLQAAGYNPALVGTGNVGSAVSSPQAQGINPPRASEYSADYSGVGSAIFNAMQAYSQYENSKQDRSLKSASEDQIRIENKYKAMQMMADLNKTLAETRDTEARANINSVLASLQRNIVEQDLSLKSATEKQIREQTNSVIMDNAMKSIDLQNYPTEVRLRIGTSAQQLYNLKLQGKLTDKEIEKTAAEIVTENEKAFNLTADTMNKQRQGSILASQDQSARIQAQYDADTYKDRVDLVKVSLRKLINNSGSDNLLHLGDAALQDLSRLTGLPW